jgi:hypothetical protein
MGVQPKPSDGIKSKRGVDKIESNRNQKLNGFKPKTETEWNQTETKSWGNVTKRKPKQNEIKPKIDTQ